MSSTVMPSSVTSNVAAFAGRHGGAVHDLTVDRVAVDRVLDVDVGRIEIVGGPVVDLSAFPSLPSSSSVTSRPSFAYS